MLLVKYQAALVLPYGSNPELFFSLGKYVSRYTGEIQCIPPIEYLWVYYQEYLNNQKEKGNGGKPSK